MGGNREVVFEQEITEQTEDDSFEQKGTKLTKKLDAAEANKDRIRLESLCSLCTYLINSGVHSVKINNRINIARTRHYTLIRMSNTKSI